MKQTLLILIASLLSLSGVKEIRELVLTPTPAMHCESCETKIINHLRFERGVQHVTTNIENQTVTIVYNADKTNKETLINSLSQIGYSSKIVSDKVKAKTVPEQRKRKR